MSRAPASIVVFARAPVPGRTKTRLIPRLGAWRAARLHESILQCTLRIAASAGAGVELHGLPRPRHAKLLRLARAYGAMLRGQHGRDLGERMYRAFARGLRTNRAVVLIGSDIPSLEVSHLRKALRLLRAGRHAVIAPTEDGGYALLGLRRVSPELFSGIAWGGSAVYRQTSAALDRLGYRWQALQALWDLDRPEDLCRYGALPLARRTPLANKRQIAPLFFSRSAIRSAITR